MTRLRITKGKFEGIQRCANEKGVIAAAAMDQRGSLQKAIGKARGSDASVEDLVEFKVVVSSMLTPHASAILLDPEYGLPAAHARAANTGLLLAYEKTGYDATVRGRMPDLLNEWSVLRLVEAGADVIKILLYYNPFDDEEINVIKHAFIERIGAECRANDVAFFLEPIAYDDNIDSKGLEFAKRKPEYVSRYMEEFSKDRYGVDVLKVEIPVNVQFVEGMALFQGSEYAQTKQDAMNLIRDAASTAQKPFIYLSAGVTMEAFIESLELAAEAGTPFSGVLCGRATWQDGIPVYGQHGKAALEDWLQSAGVDNITRLNAVLDNAAKPWWTIYGGQDNIEVVDLAVA
ncbi:MAG: tagatose 1,6-diphosphate aldolase [Chloroflexaceae bacterium]|nr:tagatose 1,6-diphosphate aldolase [Chloroflexaceae bacterium]NJO05102.1 tagatose 1,6-diphosphate aldolase [Chloroflexaceae bacterium]